MRRTVPRVSRQVGRRRGRVTAARGGAAGARGPGLSARGVACVRRVQKRPKRCTAGAGHPRDLRRLPGTTRRRSRGRRLSGAGPPQPLGVTRRQQREQHGQWGRGYGVAQRPSPAAPAVAA